MKLADGFGTSGRRPRVVDGPHKIVCQSPPERVPLAITLPTTRKEDSSGTMKTLYCCMQERLLEPHDGSGQGRTDGQCAERAHHP
jgi:hypothetical protein